MEFKHIEYFVKASEFKSMSQAAEALFISQQALSKCMQNLETELGCKLFHRTSKGSILTDEGQLLYDRFVTADKAVRFYKNNRFYDLPVRIEKIDGTYLVPLKAFAEAFGATVSYNYEDKSVLVQHGNNTLRCTIGSDIFYINDRISKSRHSLVSKEGNACIPLNILSVFFDFDPIVQGDLICLDGKKVEVEWEFDENDFSPHVRG